MSLLKCLIYQVDSGEYSDPLQVLHSQLSVLSVKYYFIITDALTCKQHLNVATGQDQTNV